MFLFWLFVDLFPGMVFMYLGDNVNITEQSILLLSTSHLNICTYRKTKEISQFTPYKESMAQQLLHLHLLLWRTFVVNHSPSFSRAFTAFSAISLLSQILKTQCRDVLYHQGRAMLSFSDLEVPVCTLPKRIAKNLYDWVSCCCLHRTFSVLYGL